MYINIFRLSIEKERHVLQVSAQVCWVLANAEQCKKKWFYVVYCEREKWARIPPSLSAKAPYSPHAYDIECLLADASCMDFQRGWFPFSICDQTFPGKADPHTRCDIVHGKSQTTKDQRCRFATRNAPNIATRIRHPRFWHYFHRHFVTPQF